ncbi:InlB B-repeat-containing protein [Methanomassiliicoccales archaeon LGM-DZ1]|nr:InlB B-repeat-containing protein [Methanomassiliicoccales archaeon LGM-DZ1]
MGSTGTAGKAIGKLTAKWMATLAVASVMVISAVMVSALYDPSNPSSVPDGVDTGFTQYITYHYDGSDTVSPYQAFYYGIASTEYNPEMWKSTGSVRSDASNWTGPSFTKNATVKISEVYISSITADNTYHLTVPDNYTPISGAKISSGSSGDATITADPENHRFDIAATVSGTFKCELTLERSVTFNKVFAGWNTASDGSGTQYLPGDVVPDSISTLYAVWIQPDIFSGNLSYSISSWGASNTYAMSMAPPSGSPDNDIIWPYCIIGANSGASKLVVNQTYYTITRGDSRVADSMYGTIYKITCVDTQWAKASNQTYPNSSATAVERIYYANSLTFPTGTYRSLQFDSTPGSPTRAQISFVDQCKCTGDVVIDNMGINSTSANAGKHGDGIGSALFAQGHVLIMGVGLTNTALSSSTDPAGGKNAPQIFGGMCRENLSPSSYDGYLEKQMVFEQFRGEANNTLSVHVGTCVIIHSGIYVNVIAGSNTSGNNGYIGNSTYPLSTYLVMKGGEVTDTLVGGCSGAGYGDIYGHLSTGDGKMDGGTFVYFLDNAYMSGDKWEDAQVGITDKYATVESSVLEGGNSRGVNLKSQAVITGSTHVFLSGKSSAWDVQAGGRSAYTHTDYAYLEASGKSVVRHVACGTITDGTKEKNNCVDVTDVYVFEDAIVANVFGAGFDTWEQPSGRSMLGGTVNVTIAGGKVGNVYGGGYRGSIGDTGANQQVTVNVTILGGEIFQNVYGGGSGGLDKVKHNSNGTMSDQTTSYYTQSMGQSYVYGDINLTIGGNAVIHGNVYGGGMSVPKLSSYDGIRITDKNPGFVSESGNVVATVYGNTSVTIQGHAKIDGSVFGAGRGVEVTYNMNTGTYEYPDQTRLYVVDMTNLSSANPFKTIPWLLNSSGQVVYEYDSALCHVENNDAYIAEGCRYVTFARVTGNASINIDLESDGYIAQEVYGGSAYGKVTGNTSVKVVKGDLKKDVFGGGLGREGIVSVSGGRTVYIAGDENVSDTVNSISGVSIKGSVYGGSSKGDDGGSTLSQYTNTVVIVRNGYIAKDIFGGGLMGNTYGNASVYVGYDNGPSGPTPYSYTEAHSHGISVDNIYAGGNVSTEYDSEGKPIGIVPFEKYLVKGSGTVIVFGDDGKRPISITGSVMGSGNSCLTADKSISSSFTTYLAINGVENRAESMSAIHRADELIITQSVLKITGRSPLVKVGSSEKTLSIYGIGTMTLRRDSIVSIEDPIDAVAQYRSLSKDNLPSTVAAPSNEIRFLTGSTFYVRDVNMVYGKVEGYTILSVETQGRYGAYVLGDALLSSNNGFVVYRDGSYDRADYSDSSGIRCWFISGVTRKVLTMNLNAETDQQGHPILTNTMATVDIQKFQDATQLRFTGGSFTSMSSDGAKMYYFDRPGTVSDTYTNLGMIVGYAPDDPSYNPGRALLYDRDTRYLDIGEESTWMYGSYYAENGDTYSEEPLRGYEDRPDRVSRTLTPVTLQAFRASETPAGIYGINFVFTATHSDRTSYIGYLVINLQESIVVTYESMEGGQSVTKENVMTTNRTEVRIDLYVIGSSGSATSANDYEVIMKTELPHNKSEGQCDIMIPTGFTNGELHITGVSYTVYTEQGDTDSVFKRSYNRDAKIYVAAISNQDKTTGWSTSAGVVESNDTMSDTVVGTLMGNISATVRYYVRDFTYEEDYPDYLSPQIHSETKRPQFTLHFYVLLNGERVNSNVTVTLIEKQKFQVTFYDSYKDPDYLSPEVRGYYEGTELTESNMPSTGPNFIGWYYAGTNFSNVYDYGQPVTKNMSLEARYTYVLTFDNMDGTSYTMYVPAEEGGTMLNKNAVPRPTATGYEFVEWFTDQDCSRQWDYTMDRITGDTTLYAKWVGKQITVHFWYTNSSGDLVSFAGDTAHVAPEEIGGNSFYVMMRVGDELIRPYVRYGSTFNTIDPYQSSGSIINILDFARQSIEATMGDNVKFICWQAYRYNDPTENVVYSIYSDTLMSGDMALERPTPGGSPTVLDVIDLYAVTATVAIQLEMSDSNNDASVHIAAPSTFLVYPDVPDDINETYDVYGYDNTIYLFLDNSTVYKWMEGTQKWQTSVTSPDTIKNNGTLLFKWSNDFNGVDYGGSFRYYLDADNNWYAVEDWNYRYIDEIDTDSSPTVYYAHDKYGNFYTKSGNNAWVKSYSIVYAVDGVEITYKHEGSSWYKLEGDLWVSCSEPSDYYFKDRFDNHYEVAWSGTWNTGNNPRTYTTGHEGSTYTITIAKTDSGNRTGTPVYKKDGSEYDWSQDDWADDHFLDQFCTRYMYAGDIYKCTYGAEAFYEFTFQLNQATRAGYRLVGWHNQHVDPMDDSYPSAGVNRTLFIFVDLTETNQPVWREILRTTEGSLYQTWVYDGVSAQPVIGDPSHLYTVGYTAVWEQLNYTVNIGNPAHGTINAYLVNEDGSRTKIDGSIDNIHYGDRIELSYAPTGNYQFSRWMITGEYIINPVGRPSTTMIVQGDCTISVSDIGDRVVTAQVYYDGHREQGGGKLNGSDADRTTAFMLNKATGEYCQMDFIPNVSDEYEFYRGYVPLGEYVFVLRYDMGEYGHNDFELMGDLTVDIEGRVDFSFYVLTARITDATTDGSTVVDYCSIPEGWQIINHVLLVDEHGNEVLRVSKYTGAIKDYIDREIDQGGAIINNPEDMIPPVRFTVAPGYFFNIYEGFPDEVSGVDQFVVNYINRYPYGTTLYGESFSGRFDLNWTRYWKPADVVVHIAPIAPKVKYAVDSPGPGEDWTATANIPYGSAFGLDTRTTELETYLTQHSIFKHVSSWKYPDGRMAVTADVFGPETAVRLGLGGTPVIDAMSLEDQYGNKYTSTSVSDLDYYIVYKTVESVESKY